MTVGYKQFAASAPVGIIELRCLEISHPAIAAPVRLVNDYRDWTVTLETGEVATFKAGQFGTVPPPISDNGQIDRTLQIDAVDGEIVNALIPLATSQEPIRCTYRIYLSDDLSEPQFNPPERTVLRGISFTGSALSASAQSSDVTNRNFPRRYYTRMNTPGLNR